MPQTKTLATQLRDGFKTIIAATHAVTNTVEAMHHSIASGPRLLNRPFEPLYKVSTAPSYKAIRHIVHAVGQGIDLGLAKLSPLIQHPELKSGPLLAAINGVWGDRLADQHSSLTIEMTLLYRGWLQLAKSSPKCAHSIAYARHADRTLGGIAYVFVNRSSESGTWHIHFNAAPVGARGHYRGGVPDARRTSSLLATRPARQLGPYRGCERAYHGRLRSGVIVRPKGGLGAPKATS